MNDPHQVLVGFPSSLQDDAVVVAGLMPEATHVVATRAQRVLVHGEAVEIPARIYNAELPALKHCRLTEPQRLIAGCVYSRHHDGYIRQAGCATIVNSPEPWVAPYVVQLLGEYVVEIANLILDRLTEQGSFSWPSCREFVDANGEFISLTEQRAISYWSCYYRHDFARDKYPALIALEKLRQAEPFPSPSQ